MFSFRKKNRFFNFISESKKKNISLCIRSIITMNFFVKASQYPSTISAVAKIQSIFMVSV